MFFYGCLTIEDANVFQAGSNMCKQRLYPKPFMEKGYETMDKLNKQCMERFEACLIVSYPRFLKTKIVIQNS